VGRQTMTSRRAASIRESSEIEEPTRPRAETSCLTALVASSDSKMLHELIEMVVHCGLSCFPASTVAETRQILDQQEVCLVVSDDRMIDGNYEDILIEAARLRPNVPVVVVSPTGDWSDYLKAISAGAFDYVAFPSIPGDFARTVRQALTFRTTCSLRDTTTTSFSSSTGGIS